MIGLLRNFRIIYLILYLPCPIQIVIIIVIIIIIIMDDHAIVNQESFVLHTVYMVFPLRTLFGITVD